LGENAGQSGKIMQRVLAAISNNEDAVISRR
jgi:hypothetical protein